MKYNENTLAWNITKISSPIFRELFWWSRTKQCNAEIRANSNLIRKAIIGLLNAISIISSYPDLKTAKLQTVENNFDTSCVGASRHIALFNAVECLSQIYCECRICCSLCMRYACLRRSWGCFVLNLRYALPIWNVQTVFFDYQIRFDAVILLKFNRNSTNFSI